MWAACSSQTQNVTCEERGKKTEQEREKEKQLFFKISVPVNRLVLPTEDTCLPKAHFLHSESYMS